MNDSALLQFVLIPGLICLARICDVTIGTIRIMYVSRGMKTLSTCLGFFEVLIWLFAIGQVMQNLTNYLNYLAYATGYALGNYVGIWIENKISLGNLVLRIITKKDAGHLIRHLQSGGYGVTSLKAEGLYGPVDIVFTIIKRREYPSVVGIIKRFNPRAVYTVEDIRHVNTPPFGKTRPSEGLLRAPFRQLGFLRRP